MSSFRIYVEKKPEFRTEAEELRAELNENLLLHLKTLRLINVYDLFGFSASLVEKSGYGVFGERVTDEVTVAGSVSLDAVGIGEDARYLAVECPY